jgi:nucleoside-diphosphate-sugar epimerase
MQGKRVLVSGAGGFIGRWSIPELQRLGYEVHAVLSGTARRDVPEQLHGAKIHFADLLEDLNIDALLSEVRPTHLLHFAWVVTPGSYWASAENLRWLAASEHLLRSFRAHGGRRVVMAGTCAEYDWSRVGICDEQSSPLANEQGAASNAAATLSAYVECKIALQRTLADFGREERLSTAWGRIFFQFGPFERPDRLVPFVICNLLLNREAPCSHGRQVRSFLHVTDVGAAFAAVLDSELEGPVNIGSDERITLAELLERIGRQIGRSDLLRLGARPAPAQEPMLLVPAVHRLRDEARWRPRFTLNEGLSDAIAWWRGRLLDSTGAQRPG